ncbi:MAG: hypothetical protein ISS25_00655 [Nanoarchaeota archaeon]|nr:hypothetical protein [DPANN group archaeon]MBL7116327.1 hypothetical protein [Nanoarchaeota archaeon]
MDNILTLNKINRSDTDIAGFRAVDLAELFNKKLNIPICFVIKSSLFDDFMEKNNLKPQISKILSEADYSNDESLEEAYAKIKELFSGYDLSEKEENELLEAYETLAIDMDHIDIAKLVTTIDKPFLTVVGSPNYVDDSENNESIFQNVKGKTSLIKAIRNSWLSLYTPRALKYRKQNDIHGEEKTAVIVQRMIETEVSAQSYSDEEEIVVKTFLGFQDYHEEFDKDVMVFSKGTLTIKNTKINFQEHQYVRDIKDNNLVKKALKEEGEKQKLNDKECEEIARITKRVEGFLEKPVKVFISMTKGKIYLLFANRIIRKHKEEIEEEPIKEDVPRPAPSEKAEETPEVEPINIEDDIAFLDDIEAYEKQEGKEEKEAEWTKESEETTEEPISEKKSDWTEEPEKEPIKTEELGEEIITTEPSEEPLPEEKEEVKTEEPEGEVSKEELPKPEEKPEETEKPVELEEGSEEDDFIFPQFEAKEEEKKPEETTPTTQQEMPIETEKTEEAPITPQPQEETPAAEEITTKPEPTEEIKETPEEAKADKMGQALEMIKKLAVLSDDAIYDALKKKHKEVVGTEATSFTEAINSLKSSVRIPFIEEIKKIHHIRRKVEKEEEIDIEEAAMALRTAKNFLSLFN